MDRRPRGGVAALRVQHDSLTELPSGGEADVLATLAGYRTRGGKIRWGWGRTLNEGIVAVGDRVAFI